MEYLSVRIIISVPQILSLLAITYMFRCYLVLRRRTLGLQMILILCIADFIFHAAFLYFTWTTDEQVNPQAPASAIMLGALRFSLFWASSIAYLALKSLSGDMKLDPVLYAKISFIIILIITVILGLVSAFVEQTLFFLLLTVFSPLLISLVWTTICYLKSISILKRHSKEKNIPIQETMRNLYIYSLIQIITSGPAVLYYFTVGYTQRGSLTWVTIVSVAVGFSGLANSSAYFFQRAMRKSMANLDRVENTGCLSNITGDSEPEEVSIDSA